MVAAALEPPKVSREPSRTVQMVFDGEGEGVRSIRPPHMDVIVAGAPENTASRRPRPRRSNPDRAMGAPSISPQLSYPVHQGVAVLLVPMPVDGTPGGPIDLSRVPALSSVLRQAQLPPARAPATDPGPTVHAGSIPATTSLPRQSEVADLSKLKASVARLPRSHPLRFALDGEPDRIPREELVAKLREWAKYFPWEER